MAHKNTLLIALTSFVVILLLIALVRYLFPRSIMGFTDMSCYGVACQEGEFCQSGSCKKIYPDSTNNYEGVEGFQNSCPSGTKQNEKGDCQAVEGFMDSTSVITVSVLVSLAIVAICFAMYSQYRAFQADKLIRPTTTSTNFTMRNTTARPYTEMKGGRRR